MPVAAAAEEGSFELRNYALTRAMVGDMRQPPSTAPPPTIAEFHSNAKLKCRSVFRVGKLDGVRSVCRRRLVTNTTLKRHIYKDRLVRAGRTRVYYTIYVDGSTKNDAL